LAFGGWEVALLCLIHQRRLRRYAVREVADLLLGCEVDLLIEGNLESDEARDAAKFVIWAMPALMADAIEVNSCITTLVSDG
jgi:hypothetical protein